MKQAVLLAAMFTVAAIALCDQQQDGAGIPRGMLTPRPEGPEWMDLLSPENMSEWSSNMSARDVFEIDHGTLHIYGAESGAHVGFMKERLRDLQLHIEFKVSPKANSGIVLRGERDAPLFTGMEIQVFDDHGSPTTKHSCGALYDVATPMFNMSLAAGQWNSFDITCQGRTLVVVMNGWKILDIDLSRLTMPIGRFPKPYAELALDGYLFLQDNVGEVWYRNIMLKTL